MFVLTITLSAVYDRFTGLVSTLAGDVVSGYVDGTGSAAKFSYPIGVAVDTVGYAYVAEYINNAIRKITPAGSE